MTELEEIKNPLLYIPRYFKVQTKADAQGKADLVSMKLWPSQKYYIENRTHRDIILKNRQTGMSTGILASNAHAFFTQPNERHTIVTHDDETSTFLLSTIRRFHNNLPPDKRPRKGYDAGHRISLSHPKMDCYMYIDSAKSDSIGIGHGLTRAHLSEVAKWPPRKEDQLYADISQTVPLGGYITIESTPKGRGGLFHRLYTGAKEGENGYRAFFFPWWWDITCLIPVTDKLQYTQDEQQLIQHIQQTEGFELSPEQVMFRREKIRELGDLFYQEYPENDIDCWLTSDISVFDGVAIRRYLQQILPGSREGNVIIWKGAIGGEKYVIGVDSAGGHEKGDFSVASVLRVRTNEYVACLRGRIPPDLFAQEVLRLGHRYNDAQIGVEKIMHGHTVLKILIDANYPKIYHHVKYDDYTGTMDSRPGWSTDVKTKPQMVDSMGVALRANDIMIWSENFLMEASSYIHEGGKYKKSPGCYDDELDALMIALQVREQVPIIDAKRQEVTSYASL